MLRVSVWACVHGCIFVRGDGYVCVLCAFVCVLAVNEKALVQNTEHRVNTTWSTHQETETRITTFRSLSKSSQGA